MKSPVHHYLIRLGGEITLKRTRARTRFQRRLKRNLKDALSSSGISCQVAQRQARIELSTADERAGEIIARVFGVRSVSKVERFSYDSLEQISARGEELFKHTVSGRSFRVRAKRTGAKDAVAFGSTDVERALGARLAPYARTVELKHPETVVSVEVAPEGRAYFFTETLDGQAGLPVGTQERALVLASGGFDSAVAAWRMLRRGVKLDYVFFNLAGPVHETGAVKVFEKIAGLWSYGSRPRLAAVDLRPFLADLEEHSTASLRQVLLKRAMLRAAGDLAARYDHLALVTGDAVGQVSSQTMVNLAVCSQATTLPILRPLISENKEAIVSEARRIGTFELSAAVREVCGLTPGQVETAARLAVVEAEEARLDPSLLTRAVDQRRTYDLRHLPPDALTLGDLGIEKPPEGAVLIDLRPRPQFESGHHPGAVHLDFSQAIKAFPSFARERPYVLYCELGLKSAQLAEMMRSADFDAWFLRR